MTMLNFRRNKIKEQVYYDFASLKHTFGFKNIDVKHGKLVKSGYIHKKVKNDFRDFLSAVESLAINTFQEYLQFYRLALTQQDTDGRNPLHYSNFEKLIVALLDIGIEKDEGFDDFSYDCQQLKFLEDDSIKCLDPRKHKDSLKEFTHFLHPDVYKKIYKEYNKERRALTKEILNTEDNNGQTPLHIVSRKGNYVLVRHFLKLGADPNKRDIKLNNALDIAENKYVRQALTNLNEEANKGNESNINRLVDEGDNINERNSILGEGPIHKAVLSSIKNKIDALRAILKHEPEIDLIDNNGWTALHHAAYNGDIDSATELCNSKANVNAYSNSFKTPLHFAALNNHPEIINLLVAKGAKIEGISNKEILKFAPSNSPIVTENIAPLLLAARKGNTDCFELLLNLGANLLIKDIRQWNCLHFAAYNGHSELVKQIISLDEDKSILIEEKNAQGHRAFDICKNEKCKSWFRGKWKRDENKLKVINKLRIKGGQQPFKILKDAKTFEKKKFEEAEKDKDEDEYSDIEDEKENVQSENKAGKVDSKDDEKPEKDSESSPSRISKHPSKKKIESGLKKAQEKDKDGVSDGIFAK